jgi:hypothetical protein
MISLTEAREAEWRAASTGRFAGTSIDTIVQWTDHDPSVQIESGGDGHAPHRTEELGIGEVAVMRKMGAASTCLHTASQYAALTIHFAH